MNDSVFKPVNLELDACPIAEDLIFTATAHPEFSWRVATEDCEFKQSAYQIVARNDTGKLLWDSGKVTSAQCRFVAWGGADLMSRQEVKLQVRVWNQQDTVSSFSDPAHFEVGLLANADWGNTQWIWFDGNNYANTAPSPLFRKDFAVKKKLQKARLYIAARGIFEPHLDGKKVGQDFFGSGWTDFKKQIQVSAYDVTAELGEGRHTLGAILADGWCCGNLANSRMRNFYHPHPELLARLELTYTDGAMEVVATDTSFQTATGAILSADLYDGETYDARQENLGWDTPDFDASLWRWAATSGSVEAEPLLVPRSAPPVRVMQELQPVGLLRPEEHICIWDFGQNFTGLYRVKFRGSKGRVYTFKTAEMLEKNGTLYTLNYRTAKSEDHYICRGKAQDVVEYTPRFTFHGFRYLQIDGWQFENLAPEDIEVTGLVLHSAMALKSDFHCALPQINQLWSNAQWGQCSNFLEIPTDCPQRDERLGWSGDAEIFAPLAVLNMDCGAFFRKYLRDMRDGMAVSGAAPSIAPAILRLWDGAAGWGDALIIIPYLLYQHYGWTTILSENYEAMQRALAFQLEHSCAGLRPDEGQFGDWLAPEVTPKGLVATAYFAYCLKCMCQIAHALGKISDKQYYADLAAQTTTAFQQKYVVDDCVTPGTQTALVLALAFELLTEQQIPRNIAALENNIQANGNKLATGFLGTGWILEVLEKYGCFQTACDLLLQEECPSWLYPVKQGATTFWERWDSFTAENHKFGDVTMNSFNHYAYGAAMRFLLEGLGGIHYSHAQVRFQIVPDARFAPVEAHYDSPYGRIGSAWQIVDGKLQWQVTVPPGGPLATAILLDGSKVVVSAGTTTLWNK